MGGRRARAIPAVGLVVTLLVMTVVGVSAQEDRPLVLGRSEVGFLFDTVDRWTFESEGEETVRVTAESLAFDTRIELRSDGGEVLGENEDCPDWTGSLRATNSCVNVTTPVAGRYEVRVIPPADGRGGLYSIGVELAATGALGVASPLTINTVAIGNLKDPQEVGRWVADFGGGQVIRVTAESVAFDTVIELRSAAGEVLVDNDDCEEVIEASFVTNSCLQTTVPRAGRYEIRVTAYRDGTGVYTVAAHTVPAAVVGVLQDGDLTYASGQYYDEYALPVGGGENLWAEVQSEAFETHLTMVSPAGARTSYAGAAVRGRSRVRVEIVGAEPGTWRVGVTSASAVATGSYELWLYARSSKPRLVHGELGAGDAEGRDGEYVDVYAVEGRAGDCLVVSLSGASGLRAGLLGPGGHHAETGAIIGDGSTVVLDDVLSAEGPYRVLVTAAVGQGGRYALELDVGACS